MATGSAGVCAVSACSAGALNERAPSLKQFHQLPAGLGAQFLGIERAFAVRVGFFEQLFSQTYIFVLGNCAILVGIGIGHHVLADAPTKLLFVERPVVIAIKLVECGAGGSFHLVEVEGAVIVGVEP